MITVEEAKKMGVPIVGMGKQSDFIISSIADNRANKNINFMLIIKELLNKSLNIKDYSVDKIEHLTVIYIVLPADNKGVNWLEGKKFSRKEKNFTISIKIPDYEQFCNADKSKALKILAEYALSGAKLYLSKEKDFDFPKFYDDVEKLFKDNGML